MVLKGSHIEEQHEDSQSESEEIEQSAVDIEKESMSGLILGFKPPVKGEKKRKAPPLPPRDDISEDSLEDQVSDLDSMPPSTRNQNNKRESRVVKRTIDVDTILKNATDGLDDSSVASSAFVGDSRLGDNRLPLPEPLDRNIMINDQYLNKFKRTQNFTVYRVVSDFHGLEPRHLSAHTGSLVSGFADEGNWVCAFRDTSPNKFGFLPKNYLKFDHQTNSNRATPQGAGNQDTPSKHRRMPSNLSRRSSKSTHHNRTGSRSAAYLPMIDENNLRPSVANFLENIYDQASSEMNSSRKPQR